MWIIMLGTASLGIFWYFASLRFRSSLVYSGIGLLIALILIANGYSRAMDTFAIIFGCIIGGLTGWFVDHQTIKWTIALGAVGALTGGTIQYSIFLNGMLPILIMGTLGGFIGVFISGSRYRRPITLIIFGCIYFVTLIAGWEILKLQESLIKSLY